MSAKIYHVDYDRASPQAMLQVMMGRGDATKLPYRFAGMLPTDDPQRAFALSQNHDRCWSKDGQQRSTSVGDAIVINGCAYWVLSMGFSAPVRVDHDLNDDGQFLPLSTLKLDVPRCDSVGGWAERALAESNKLNQQYSDAAAHDAERSANQPPYDPEEFDFENDSPIEKGWVGKDGRP